MLRRNVAVHRSMLRRETEYSIRLLPLGGYVKILGMETQAKRKQRKGDEKRNLSKKPKWQQIIVMAAGVTMNIF